MQAQKKIIRKICIGHFIRYVYFPEDKPVIPEQDLIPLFANKKALVSVVYCFSFAFEVYLFRKGEKTMILKLTSTIKSSRKLLAGALRVYARHLEQGSRFPSENELISEFKIARMTLRRAIDDLVAEGTLYRKWGSGTFVAQSNSQTVHFVLPFLENRRGELQNIFCLTDIFDELKNQAKEMDIVLIPLAASLTNRRNELDLEMFRQLPDGTAVILPGYWFSELFDLLRAKKCKVAFVTKLASFDYLYEKQVCDWFRIEYDLNAAVQLSMEHLRKCNVRRAVLIDNDNHWLSPYQAGLRAALKDDFFPELVIYGCKNNDFGGNILACMLKSRDRYPFEAIIASNVDIAQKAQKILSDLNIEMPLVLLEKGKVEDKISFISYPNHMAAELALKQLTDKDSLPGVKTIKPIFNEAESTRKFFN